MTPKSEVFARIKHQLFTLIELIPKGQLAELGEVAKALNIPPRHAAYIISQMRDYEKEALGWRRVVPTGGKFPPTTKRSRRVQEQISHLAHEGVAVDDPGQIPDFRMRCFGVPMDNTDTIWADEIN